MASRKKQSEGIDLLSIYNDEDDEDMEDLDDQQQEELSEEMNDYRESNEIGPDSVTDELATEATPPVLNQNSTPKERPLTPQQPQVLFSSSPQQQQQRVVSTVTRRSGRGRLTIVDYAHDEVAMSPEPDEEEFAEELQTANGASQERTPPGTVQILTPSVQATPQSSENLETLQQDEMNTTVNQPEAAENEVITNVPAENVDLLDKFLPAPPKDKCPEELQRKIDKFLALKKVGRSFNAEVRNKKDYRNPDFLLHAVRYQDIDQIGSCFSKDVFDPHGYDKSDFYDEIGFRLMPMSNLGTFNILDLSPYILEKDVFDPHGYDKSDFYDEIEADMRREKERKEQELKKSPKVEFISGGAQPGQVVPPPKFSIPIPVPAAASGLHSASIVADAVARDGRQNKKSKWDKVDGDGRNPLPTGGQDSLATAAAHAALLSAANVGAGYTAFVQQKRREAEEKRSSEKKLERRS